nr:GPP34 family phosphoprotein [Actinomadura sp. CNU-125]
MRNRGRPRKNGDAETAEPGRTHEYRGGPAARRERGLTMVVRIPESLPARMFLLAYDLRKQKMTKRGRHLGYLLRAAALTELYLDGRLGDDDKARPRPGTPGADPYGLVAQIAEAARPRSWQHWVRKDGKTIVGASANDSWRTG